MATDDPREPRFGSMSQERLDIPEPVRPEPPQIEPEPEPIGYRQSWPTEGNSRNLWRLIGGIAAAVILVVVIVVMTRHPTTATKPAPVAAAAPAVTPAPSGDQTAAPAVAPPASPPPAPPVTTAPSPKPSAIATPHSALTTGVAPSRAAAAPSTTASSAVSAHGPKHRRRGPSATAPWLIQVGAFKAPSAGQSVVDRLAKDGWSARTAAGYGGWTIVEVTGYRTKEEAERAAKMLAAKAHVPTLVRKIKAAHDADTDDPKTVHHAKRTSGQ